MEYCELCGVWGLYQRCYGFLFIARWILWHSYYCRLIFFITFFQYFSNTIEKEVGKPIELELKRDCDKMKIGQKQIEFFFQSKFKIRLNVSCFSQKIKNKEYLTCIHVILSSVWLPAMESSISFWTNSPPKIRSCYVFIPGAKLSIITFPLISFMKLTLFATPFDMKPHLNPSLIKAPRTIFFIQSGFLINNFSVS